MLNKSARWGGNQYESTLAERQSAEATSQSVDVQCSFPFAAVKRRRTQGRSDQWRAHSQRPAFAFRSQRRASECPGRSVALRGGGTGGGPWRLSTAHRCPVRRHAPPWAVRCGQLSDRSTMSSTAVHEREQTSVCSLLFVEEAGGDFGACGQSVKKL